MSHAARQLSERFHLLGLSQLLFECQACGDIDRDPEAVLILPRGAVDRGERQFRPDDGTIGADVSLAQLIAVDGAVSHFHD